LSTLPRPVGVKPRSTRQQLHTLADAVLGLLPLLLLGMGLLLTVWLLRMAPSPMQAAQQKKTLAIPDYDVRQFKMSVYGLNGQLKSEMQGTAAQHFPASMTTLVDQPRFFAFSSAGNMTNGVAKQALLNEDGSEVQLMGQVQLQQLPTSDQPDTLTIQGEFLHFFANTDEVKSHVPVQAVRGQNTFKANRMHADNLHQVMQLNGRVKAVLAPKKSQP
jgi:lipopolysaccharide export system protein LptC